MELLESKVLANKVKKIIFSCRTKEQLETAINFANLAFKKVEKHSISSVESIFEADILCALSFQTHKLKIKTGLNK